MPRYQQRWSVPFVYQEIMKLIGLMPVRDDAWSVGLTIPAALMWCDELVVLNHASGRETDRLLYGQKLIYDAPLVDESRITLLSDSNPLWREMAHRQWMLDAAKDRGATHIALVDADEILTGNILPNIRQYIGSCPPGQVFQLPIVCPWRSVQQYRVDWCPHTSAWVSTGFQLTTDCCWRTRAGGYDHHSRHPFGTAAAEQRPVKHNDGGVMHLQWLRWRALVAKHALYKMVERIRWPDKYTPAKLNEIYGLAMNVNGLKTAPIPDEWWKPYRHLMSKLNTKDMESWHHAECQRLWEQHGPEKFAGLDLFGVIKEANQ